MREIVNKLHEKRQVELAKSILESKGYTITKKDISESGESPKYTWGDWQSEKGSACRVKYYSAGQDLTNAVLGVIYEPGNDGVEEWDDYGVEIYDNSIADVLAGSGYDGVEGFATEEEAKAWIEEWFNKNA